MRTRYLERCGAYVWVAGWSLGTEACLLLNPKDTIKGIIFVFLALVIGCFEFLLMSAGSGLARARYEEQHCSPLSVSETTLLLWRVQKNDGHSSTRMPFCFMFIHTKPHKTRPYTTHLTIFSLSPFYRHSYPSFVFLHHHTHTSHAACPINFIIFACSYTYSHHTTTTTTS